MEVSFTKMSGAGNDFIVVDNREKIIDDAGKFALSTCHRHLGIGADGVLLVEQSSIADFTMKYYNADGSYGGMCGNGGRCIAKFAFDNDIVQQNNFSFEALNYVYSAQRYAPELYELTMKDPIDLKMNLEANVNDLKINLHFIDTGSPHCVILLDENSQLEQIDLLDVHSIGKALRYSALFAPKGTNVNFIQQLGANNIRIRTYERGVEAETLACGTGSIASGILSAIKNNWTGPILVQVQSGELLEISFQRDSTQFKNVKLKGSARTIFKGMIDI